eukprot:CAMPEP_0181358212 /NCGR_PEP_ID=MMETSP1106-20121128/5389_1 /TAXON_ID=81844 /ORGANISM="Mantoniella antarctica, Strain SL-175" /LENGTH=450 /DNA_ID=CAMNT_0023471157 /DNA_START=325 /DNA_END=1677 /DNA_ORIENTATION=-
MSDGGEGEVKTLWIGDLGYWMEESYLYTCFAHMGGAASVKIIRNKQTGFSEGYGFVEFADRATAEYALRSQNGTPMPSAHQNFRLNWASFGVGGGRGSAGEGGGPGGGVAGSNPGGGDFSIFVGDLPPEVNDYVLQETFSQRYASVRNARVVTDPATGRSKGFGFVRFSEDGERDRALIEMNAVPCGSRLMRISLAIPRKANLGATGSGGGGASGGGGGSAVAEGGDETGNSTVFVGGLDPALMDVDLKQYFEPFGELVYVKIPAGKGCGFVQYVHRSCAEQAITQLNGSTIGASRVRLSWVRSNASNQQGHGYGQARGMASGMGVGTPYPPAYGTYPTGVYGAYAGTYGGVDPAAAGYYAGYAVDPYAAMAQQQQYAAAAAAAAGYYGHGAHHASTSPAAAAAVAAAAGAHRGVSNGLPVPVMHANAAYAAAHERNMMSRHIWMSAQGY